MASKAGAKGPSGASDEPQPLSGIKLLIAGIVLAMANFTVVLDLTIANVSVPHIAGGLAVSVSSGTWVITSYAVAEAICVPLTGWLAQRFGALRTLTVSLIGFGLFSIACGFSSTLGMLVVFRIGQGFCGGPLMPLTQTLMLRIFPKEHHSKAMALWAMTVVIAPIMGPIFGGLISDNWSWPWIFFINVPIIFAVLFGVFTLLRGAETPTQKRPIDGVGLGLLVIWVGALQVMLDKGREEDWFASSFIVTCAVIAAIFFALFLIWELTQDDPIVDLKVFRHRGFSAATVSLTFAFGTYFAAIVVIPQWLQTSLGYTATNAGYVMAFSGVLAVIMSPFVPALMKRFDPRLLVFVGIAWIGVCSLLRSLWWSTDASFWTLAMPQLLQGAGVSLFMVPLTTISLGSVGPTETASAAGLINFGRTLAAIFFALFLIWELTQDDPIVDLKVFRHRGFSAATVSLTFAFGTYFAAIVVIPQWLQTSLGYTATNAGYVMAFSGVLAVIMSPFVPALMKRFDPRLLVFVGIAWIGVCSLLRSLWWSTDASFWTLAMPQLLQGAGVSLFMVPLTTISLGSVGPTETASAAGLINFGRTLAGAVATAMVTTYWTDQARTDTAQMAGNLNGAPEALARMEERGMGHEQARATLENLVTQQGMAVGTTHLFMLASVVLLFAASTIWLAPKPPRGIAPASGH